MKNPDLLRSPRSSSLQRTFMYASFLETFACLPVGRGALHLGLFDQPLRNLLVCITDEPHRAERIAHRENTSGVSTSHLQLPTRVTMGKPFFFKLRFHRKDAPACRQAGRAQRDEPLRSLRLCGKPVFDFIRTVRWMSKS